MQRREFLALVGRGGIGASAALATGSSSALFAGAMFRVGRAQDAAFSLDKGFAQVTEIAAGVYATIANPAKGPQCLSNGGVIAGKNAVLVIEGHYQPEGAAFELELAKMVSKAKVHAAINTHFHLDHTFGNTGYTRAGVKIIGHELVPKLMKERYQALKGVPKGPLMEEFEKKIAGERDQEPKERLESDRGAWQWIYDSSGKAEYAFPTELLRSEDLPKKLDLGGLTAVIEFHRGHSPTDLIIRVPERDVVFTGDLLFNHELPVCMDADMPKWRAVLDTFSGFGGGTQFVPGHGGVCNREVVAELAALFDDLRAHADRMKEAGASVDEASRRYQVPKQFEEWGPFSWELTMGDALKSYYEVSGKAS
jgi:cyclase